MTFLRQSLLLTVLLTLSGCVIAIDTDRDDERKKDKAPTTQIITVGEKSDAELLQALVLARQSSRWMSTSPTRLVNAYWKRSTNRLRV